MLNCSIVVSFHNEEEDVTELYDRLKVVMEAADEPFELVFVDDGSDDNTFWLLEQIASVDRRVVVVKLRRNFPQTSALAAGFDQAEGEYIIAWDSDQRHDPRDIPVFLQKLREGYDIVGGWRKPPTDRFVLRDVPAKIANWLMATLSGVELHDFGTTFKAYRREVVQEVPIYGELHRFIPALASAYGATICEVPIRNLNRERGESPYGISPTFRVLLDLIAVRFLLKYMARPLHVFGGMGMLAMVSGGGVGIWLAIQKILNPTLEMMEEHGPLLVFAAMFVLAGVQLLAFGLLGEMQVRYRREPRRVPYSLERVVRAEERERSTHSE